MSRDIVKIWSHTTTVYGLSDTADKAADFLIETITEAPVNTYLIFQTNFGFMGGDTPFTMYVSKDDVGYYIWFYSADWCLFKIEDEQCKVNLKQWRCGPFGKDPIINDDLTAGEIISLLCEKGIIDYPDIDLRFTCSFNEPNVLAENIKSYISDYIIDTDNPDSLFSCYADDEFIISDIALIETGCRDDNAK